MNMFHARVFVGFQPSRAFGLKFKFHVDIIFLAGRV